MFFRLKKTFLNYFSTLCRGNFAKQVFLWVGFMTISSTVFATRDCYIVIRGRNWVNGRFFADQGKIFQAIAHEIHRQNQVVKQGGWENSIELRVFDCDEKLETYFQDYRPRTSEYDDVNKFSLATDLAHFIIRLKKEEDLNACLITYGHGIDITSMASQLLNFKRTSLQRTSSGIYGTMDMRGSANLAFLEASQELKTAWRGQVNRSYAALDEEQCFIQKITTVTPLVGQQALANDINYVSDEKTVAEVQHLIPPSDRDTLSSQHQNENVIVINSAERSSCLLGCLACMQCTKEVITSEAAQEIAKLIVRAGITAVVGAVI